MPRLDLARPVAIRRRAGATLLLLASTACGRADRSACLPLAPALAERIVAEMEIPDGALRNGWAVRRTPGSPVHYVSAEVDGEGFEGDGQAWTWVVSSLDPDGAQVYSAINVVFAGGGGSGGAGIAGDVAADADAAARKSLECMETAP